MPTTLTLKSIDGELCERLNTSAATRRRRLNSGTIVRLESPPVRSAVTPADHIAGARDLRGVPQRRAFKTRDTDAAKRRGRA